MKIIYMKCHPRFAGIFFAFMLFALPSPSWSQSQLQEYLSFMCRENNIPGIAVTVLNTQGMVATEVYGKRRIDAKQPIEKSDLFHIGSCTKSFTGLIMASLIEEGIVDWDTAVLDFFKELSNSIDDGFRNITVRHLLSHKAGIAPYTSHIRFPSVPEFEGEVLVQRKQFAFWLLEQKPTTPMGSKHYSNAGYGIAAAIEEELTGKTWETLVTEKILLPCYLNRSGFGWPALQETSGTYGHWDRTQNRQPPVVHEANDEWYISNLNAPAGDLFLSIEDMGLYLSEHLKGLHDIDSVYRSSLIKAAHNSDNQYSCGWGIQHFGNDKFSLHFGSAGTYVAAMAVGHNVDVAAAVMMNVGGERAIAAANDVLLYLLKLNQ